MVKINITLRQLNLFTRCVKNDNIKYSVEEKELVIDKNQLDLIINAINDYYKVFGVKYDSAPTKLGNELIDLKEIILQEYKKSPSN